MGIFVSGAGARASDESIAIAEDEAKAEQAWIDQSYLAHAVLVDEAPLIDGVLDDAIWEKAHVITNFTQVEPKTGAAPSFASEVRILTDGEAIYFYFRAYDPEPDKIVANRMARTEIFFFDDGFNILLDTFHDRRNGYFFQVNPNGGRRDGTFERDNFEENWDGIWYADARIDEEGWTAEVAIPFQTLGFRENADDWGLNLSRRIRRFNEDIRWADPTLERQILNMSRAGTLTGMSVARQGVGLDVVPAFSLGGEHDEIKNRDKINAEPSFDAFYRLLPSLTASVTANTDFAQTEIDNAQLNLSRFELFFPEKREFFLRDTGLFNFGGLSNENAIPFFSRRIGLDESLDSVRLWGGGRLAGRAGPMNIGLLDIQQDKNAGTDSTNLAVGRISANVLEESLVGVIVTHGDPTSDDENLLVGGDFNFRSSQIIKERFVKATAWIQQSFTENENDRYGDRSSSYGGSISYPNDRVNWEFQFKDIQRGFNPALGFVNRTDIRRYDGTYRYRIRSQTSLVRTWDLTATANLTTDRDDEAESAYVSISPLKLTNQVDDSVELRFVHLFEDVPEPFYISSHVGIPAGTYNFPSAIFDLSTSEYRKLSVKFTTGIGAFYDGWGVRVNPRIEWRPSKYWLFEVAYDERQFFGLQACRGFTADTVANDCTSNANSDVLRTVDFATRVARFRVQIAFNPDIAWSTIVQYNSQTNDLSAQTRFRWIIEPGREFFIVIGQDFDATPGEFRVGTTEPVAKLRWTFRF